MGKKKYNFGDLQMQKELGERNDVEEKAEQVGVPGPHYNVGADTSHLSNTRYFLEHESPQPEVMVRGLGVYPTPYAQPKR